MYWELRVLRRIEVAKIDVLTISGERSIMFYCEMCGSGDCCERTDIHGGLILCDTCYMEAKQDQEEPEHERKDKRL